MTSSAPTRRRTVVGALLVTAGVLAGGAVAAGAATPGPSAAPSGSSTAGPSATAARPVAPGPSATPSPPERTAEQEAARRAARAADKAARRAAKTARQASRRPDAGRSAPEPAVTGPAFVCDPALTHGQNVSKYARSLPKGPGRGRLVSQAARSDCGRPGD